MPYSCDICKVVVLTNSKSNHLKSKAHKKNCEIRGSGKRQPLENTVNKYQRGVNIVAKLIKKDITVIGDWINDVDYIIPILKDKYSNPSTYNFYVTSLQHFSKLANDGKGLYSDEIQKAVSKTREKREENKLSETQAENGDFNNLTWKKLADKIDLTKANDEEKLIVKLYMMFPPRRGNEFANMKYTTSKKPDEIFNYILLSKNGVPIEFIFNVYKTSRSYGQQRFKIPNELKTFIRSLNPKNNAFVFDGRQSDKGISKFIQRTFDKYSSYDVGSQMLRRLYITDFLDKKRTQKEKKDLANMMAHSINEQGNYEIVDD